MSRPRYHVITPTSACEEVDKSVDRRPAPCSSPAIFAVNGDADRALVYRCVELAGHRGPHHGGGLSWSDRYPVPEPDRIAAAEAGGLREYDAAHA